MSLSPELKAAVSDIEAHARQMQAIITISKYVKDIEQLEQLASEAEGGRGRAKKEIEAADARVAEAQKQVADAEAAIGAAEATAADVLRNARKEAEQIISTARSEAKAIAAEAQRAAQAERDKGKQSIAEAAAKLEAINTEIDETAAERDRLVAESSEAQKKADEARAYLKNLAGG